MIEKLYSNFLQHPHICTDTRNIIPGSIFFALKGDSFDGNEFATEAITGGCALAVIDDKKYYQDDKQFILASDVLQTLQELAAHHRKQFNIPVIAITGSNGKTTTKELINAVLSQQFQTTCTRGNFNNHIGVPLTVLKINHETEIAIIEMGANHQGEIAALCKIAHPEYGLITNIGKAHLEGFGSLEGVASAKNELNQYLRESDGTAFVNADDKLLFEKAKELKHATFGTSSDCDITGELVHNQPFLELGWKTSESKESLHYIKSQLMGDYNMSNMLASICIGNYFGITPSNIKTALENYVPDNNRSQLLTKGSNQIIMDAYNANPTSMSLAIENFKQSSGDLKIVILGDMLELGSYSDSEHQEIVDILSACQFSKVILVGAEFAKTKKPKEFMAFPTYKEAMEHLSNNKIEHASILIKGSHAMKLERLTEVL